MTKCLECEQDFMIVTEVSTLFCLDCSIIINNTVLKRYKYTKLDGSMTHRKLLRRKQMLLTRKLAEEDK